MKLPLALSLIMMIASLTTNAADLVAPAHNKKALAEYSFGMMDADEENIEPQIFVMSSYQTTLFSDKTLQVKKSTFTSENQWGGNGRRGEVTVVTKTLSKQAFEVMFQDVTALSNAEIATTKNNIVCMLMPGWGMSQDNLMIVRGFDYETHNFSSPLTLVDGPHGCWLTTHTHPKAEYDRATAKMLKRSLKLLAL